MIKDYRKIFQHFPQHWELKSLWKILRNLQKVLGLFHPNHEMTISSI